MAKVFLGVGHGGSDPGAVANGFREKDLNLSIALACNEELVRHGVITLMSRTVDENDSLPEEIRECNAFAPDLAVDIHNNAGGGVGAEAFYHYGGGVGKTLAENILSQILEIGQNIRGAKTKKNSAGKDYFGFIRETNCPAVIVECAFVDNRTDMAIIDTAEEQRKMGIALAKGILATLGIEFVEEKKTATPSVLEWQKAAIADGFKPPKYFPEYGDDGIWGKECEAVAEDAVVKMRSNNFYIYENLTKIVQKAVGFTGNDVDGKCGIKTDFAIKEYQKKSGLAVDGEVGIKTWKKILNV